MHIGCGLLLYHKGFMRPSEGEECLVGEQDNERAKKAHFLEAVAQGDRTLVQGGPVLYSVDLTQPLGVPVGWAQGKCHHDIRLISESGLDCRR